MIQSRFKKHIPQKFTHWKIGNSVHSFIVPFLPNERDLAKTLEIFYLISCLCLWWQVEVLNPDETPAQGVDVVIDPGQVEGCTAANGMARITINIGDVKQPLTISVSLF